MKSVRAWLLTAVVLATIVVAAAPVAVTSRLEGTIVDGRFSLDVPPQGVTVEIRYLNAGFRLPIASGTDKMDVDIPLGSNRTYIPAGRDAGYAEWIQGIKAGKGFITTGPLLEFEVHGHAAGDVVRIDAPRKVHARATARSILPLATLEIVQNGNVAGHKTVFVQNNLPVDGVYSMEVDAEVVLGRSCWLAARVADDPDNKNRILPRGRCHLAWAKATARPIFSRIAS